MTMDILFGILGTLILYAVFLNIAFGQRTDDYLDEYDDDEVFDESTDDDYDPRGSHVR